MTRLYVPVDVNLPDDEKVVAAGPDAEHLYLRSLMLAKRIGSDGRIARGHLPRLAGDLTAVTEGLVTLAELAARLVDVGLWVTDGDGWRIAAWLRHNLPAEEMAVRTEERRARDRERQARRRQAPSPPEPTPDPPAAADVTDLSRADGSVTREVVTPLSRRDTSVTRAGVTRSEVKCSEVKYVENSKVELALDGAPNAPPPSEIASSAGGTASSEIAPSVVEVFDFWRQTCGHQRAVLDAKRRRRIEWALKHYPLEDVADAIRGAAASRWHRGENDRGKRYDDIELILRDAPHLERFRDEYRRGARPVPRGFGALVALAEGGEP